MVNAKRALEENTSTEDLPPADCEENKARRALTTDKTSFLILPKSFMKVALLPSLAALLAIGSVTTSYGLLGETKESASANKSVINLSNREANLDRSEDRPPLNSTAPSIPVTKEIVFTTADTTAFASPHLQANKIMALPKGATVNSTSTSIGGWTLISLNNRPAYVQTSLIAKIKPAVALAQQPKKPLAKQPKKLEKKSKPETPKTAEPKTVEPKTAEPKTVTGYSTAPCKHSSQIESHLTPKTKAVFRAVCAAFPNITTYGGYRPGSWGFHPKGRAIDIMISGESGMKVAKWAQDNANQLSIIEIIYQQKIWFIGRDKSYWRPMKDRGSVSANHWDHVHLSVGS